MIVKRTFERDQEFEREVADFRAMRGYMEIDRLLQLVSPRPISDGAEDTYCDLLAGELKASWPVAPWLVEFYRRHLERIEGVIEIYRDRPQTTVLAAKHGADILGALSILHNEYRKIYNNVQDLTETRYLAPELTLDELYQQAQTFSFDDGNGSDLRDTMREAAATISKVDDIYSKRLQPIVNENNRQLEAAGITEDFFPDRDYIYNFEMQAPTKEVVWVRHHARPISKDFRYI